MLDNVREHDGRAFTYLAQHQPHLGVIQISLDVDPTRIKTIDRIVLSTDDNGDDVAWITLEDNNAEQATRSEDVLEKTFAIKLPAPAEGQAVRFNVDAFKTTYEFKLSSRRSPGESLPSQPPLSAIELLLFQPAELSCTHCHRPLAVLRRDGKNGPLFRPLPSPHYQELIEAYLCHPSGEFAKKMDDVGEKGFWPDTVATTEGQREVILVGETELRLDATLVPDRLRGQMTDTSMILSLSRWTDFTCECGSIVGEWNRHAQPPERNSAAAMRDTLKLWKHSIRLGRSDGSALAYKPEVFVVAEMLSLAQAHSTRRFMLHETGQEHLEIPRLMLWLFQPEMAIASGAALESGSVCGTRSDVAKILYSFPSKSPDSIAGERETLQIEPLSYPAEIIDQVLVALRSSNELLPMEQRRMGSHEVGYLARC